MYDRKRVRLLCGVSFALGASLTLLTVSIVSMSVVRHYREKLRAPLLAHAASRGDARTSPYGRISALEIPLANPTGTFPDQSERLQPIKWFFEGATENGLRRFLNSCDLLPIEKKYLLDQQSWLVLSNGIQILPPEQIVWSLGHEARHQIYSVLSKSKANYPQCFPFRFPLEGFELRFQESGLTQTEIQMVRRLTYTNGGYLCFTDLEAVQKALHPEDFKDLIETLYAIPTYILRLEVSPDANVEAMSKYWGKGGREKRILPILSSLARVPGGSFINVTYLMPPFPRLRLYTFPQDWNEQAAVKEDCFFTSMNFFSETPDTNFFDTTYSRHVLDTQYTAVTDNPAYGDVVTMFNPAGEAVHACVYIAEDFVFTKNGVNPSQPWVIMRMADMLQIYLAPMKSGNIVFFRRKDS